jgi:hypothetical protein
VNPDDAPTTDAPSRLLAFLRQPLTRVQALVGISAGSLTIAGTLASFLGLSTASAGRQGELVALVEDVRSRRPVAEATVEILNREAAVVATLVTDGGGRIHTVLREGRYRVQIRRDGFTAASRPVEVQGGRRTDVRVALAPRAAPVTAATARKSNEPGPIRRFFQNLGL